MGKTLKALWRGEISPQERFFNKDSIYSHLLEQITKEQNAVLKELSTEGKEHLEAYEKALWQLQAESEEEVFLSAFKLGANMMLETLQ